MAAIQLQSIPPKWKQRRGAWSIVGAGTVLAAVFGVIAAKLVGGGLSALHPINPPSMPGGIVVFPLLLLLPVLWRWPRASLVALLAGTTLIDQFQYSFGPATNPAEYKGHINIPLFRSLSNGSFVSPAEILLFALLLIWLMKGALAHNWHVPRSPLAKSIAAIYVVSLVVGLGIGRLHHGQIKIALWEFRDWYYVGIMYLLTSSFFAGRNVFRSLLWTIVLGSGVKSLEGVFNFFAFARKLNPRPEAILSHEEAFFFGVFLLTTLALWLFQVRGRLRTVATVFAPLVLIADVGNSRRTAFLILYVGLAALLAIAYFGMPERRRVLRRLNVVLALVAVAYIGVFWNGSGALGQPARAIHSAVAPTPRDRASDEYRVLENLNLEQRIRANRSTGEGYGVPINYGFGLVNLTSLDSTINFVPHNGVLYEWYRLGLIGEILLWCIVGFGIVTGCHLAKQGDREAAALGAIGTCAILAFVLMGYYDLGFSWFRITLFMGFMLGALESTYQRVGGPRPVLRAAKDGSGSMQVTPIIKPSLASRGVPLDAVTVQREKV